MNIIYFIWFKRTHCRTDSVGLYRLILEYIKEAFFPIIDVLYVVCEKYILKQTGK